MPFENMENVGAHSTHEGHRCAPAVPPRRGRSYPARGERPAVLPVGAHIVRHPFPHGRPRP